MGRFDPILSIKKWWLADNRPGLSRRPGAMLRLVNTFPNLTGEERVRPGYSAYASTDGGSTPGQDMPSGFEILKVAPIQTPAQDDVHLKFVSSGGQKIYMNPWYQAAVRQSTDMQLNESKGFTGSTGSVSAQTLTITGADALGLSSTDHYYDNWLLVNETLGKFALIGSYDYTAGGSPAGTGAFFLDAIIDGSLSSPTFLATHQYTLYRCFHDNRTFSPAYNTDLANAPVVNCENSIIRMSGGQGSTNGLRGIWINPHIKRAIFPGTGFGATVEGTYASERELKALDIAYSLAPDDSTFTGTSVLTADRTYWVGIAPVYDGFQEGKLQKYETPADYVPTSGTTFRFIQNYRENLVTGFATAMGVYIQVNLGTLNKRITGFAVYMAIDQGDTRTNGRVSAYQFMKFISIIDTVNPAGWVYDPVSMTHQAFFYITQDDVNASGSTYQDDSGIIETPPDTMYAYSSEVVVGTQRFISNAYVTSETFVDRENVFTNPIGGNALIGNVGVIQPDVFSNEEAIYRQRVDPTVGTKITGLVQTGISEFLILKDRGCVLARILDIDGVPDLNRTVISHDAGAATLNGFTKDDRDWIYFVGYSDIFRYKDGALEALIERPDKNDWLDTYRNVVSSADKENVSCVFLPEIKGLLFFFANQLSNFEQKQYVLFPDYIDGESNGWRELRLAEAAGIGTVSFKYFCKLQNGHTLGVTSSSPAVKRLIWLYNSGESAYRLDYIDGSTAIAPFWDTGDFIVADGRDLRLNKLHILKTIDSALTGTLDCEIYLDGALIRTYLNQDKATAQMIVNSLSDDIRVGYTLRFRYNVNTSRERLLAGSKLQFDGILIYGDMLPHFRVTENQGGLTKGGLVIIGTINGVREVTITTANVPQTFTFDIPFTETYVGSLATEPTYRFDIDSAHPLVSGVEDTSINVAVSIVSRTLTTITLTAAEDNTIVRYSIS